MMWFSDKYENIHIFDLWAEVAFELMAFPLTKYIINIFSIIWMPSASHTNFYEYFYLFVENVKAKMKSSSRITEFNSISWECCDEKFVLNQVIAFWATYFIAYVNSRRCHSTTSHAPKPTLMQTHSVIWITNNLV